MSATVEGNSLCKDDKNFPDIAKLRIGHSPTIAWEFQRPHGSHGGIFLCLAKTYGVQRDKLSPPSVFPSQTQANIVSPCSYLWGQLHMKVRVIVHCLLNQSDLARVVYEVGQCDGYCAWVQYYCTCQWKLHTHHRPYLRPRVCMGRFNKHAQHGCFIILLLELFYGHGPQDWGIRDRFHIHPYIVANLLCDHNRDIGVTFTTEVAQTTTVKAENREP